MSRDIRDQILTLRMTRSERLLIEAAAAHGSISGWLRYVTVRAARRAIAENAAPRRAWKKALREAGRAVVEEPPPNRPADK